MTPPGAANGQPGAAGAKPGLARAQPRSGGAKPGPDFRASPFTVLEDRCRLLRERVLAWADPDRPLRILDLGCGTGRLVFLLAEDLPKARLVGLDISEPSIRAAEQQRASSPLADRASFVACDYMDYRGGPFDLIISWGVLHLIAVPTPDLLGRLTGDLSSGGVLIHVMPYPCLHNRMLAMVRRVCRLLRGRATDALILRAARLLHGRDMDEQTLRERVEYMYIIPERYDGPAWRRQAEAAGLEHLADYHEPHASCAQMRQRAGVFRKRG